MTRKKRRLLFVALGLLVLFSAVGLTLTALQDNLVFFYSPTDLKEKHIEEGRRLRIGGLVQEGSVEKEGERVRFVVTDLVNRVPVTFTGLLPDLFREGQGVVAEGRLGPEGIFLADSVLAKHDENYMPPEVADALKASGQWEHGPPPSTVPTPEAATHTPTPEAATHTPTPEAATHTPTPEASRQTPAPAAQ